MLDLKAKLLSAGLVTKEQADAVTKQKKPPKTKKAKKNNTENSYLKTLKKLDKEQQYGTIRKWVERNRLDYVRGIPSEKAKKYFFEKADKNVSWLTLEPEVTAQIDQGLAGIMAYMSHHGLTHCVVPAEIIKDVIEVFPNWVRVLKTDQDKPLTTSKASC